MENNFNNMPQQAPPQQPAQAQYNQQQVQYNQPQAQYTQQPQPAYPQPHPYQRGLYMPVKKVYEPLSKKDNSFIFIFLAAMFLFVDFALFNSMALGFTISYFVIFIISTVYLYKKESKPDLFSLLCGVISLAGAVTFTLYANTFINAIMFVLICGLFTLYCLGISGSYSRSRGNFKMLFDLFSGAVVEPFENFANVFGGIRAGIKKGKRSYSAVFGALLAVPVLVVIIPLLVKSDAAFESLVKTIAEDIGRYLLEIAIALLFTPFVISYMFGKRNRLNIKKNTLQTNQKRVFAPSGSVAFLSVISVTYVVYLITQLAYFFSAFKGLLPEGYTRSASAFARRGFYETFAICAINVIIISLISMLTKRKGGKLSPGVKCLSLFISLFSVLLIITAIQKMKLNISTYGFTRNRLLVFTFMLMMLVVIAFFIIHIFAPKVHYMQSIIVICSVMFVALSFMDIDTFTYEHNYKAYKNGTIKSMEMYTVSTLCPSNKFFVELAKENDEKLSHRALAWMIEDNNFYESRKFRIKDGEIKFRNGDFRSYNKARADSEKALKDYYKSLSDADRAAFDDIYNKLIVNDGSYMSEDDRISVNGYEYDYNPKTHKYDIKVEYEEAE